MNETMKDLIKRLEEITMALHRSAGNLDKIVQDMKVTLECERSAEFCEHYVGVIADNRAMYLNHCFKDLEKKEQRVWQMFLEEANKLKNEEIEEL